LLSGSACCRELTKRQGEASTIIEAEVRVGALSNLRSVIGYMRGLAIVPKQRAFSGRSQRDSL
jgi:hypothetical protein